MEKNKLTKREKTIIAVTGIIIIGLLAVVIYQYFTIVKVQKQLAQYSDENIEVSDDGKIVWINPDVTVTVQDYYEDESNTDSKDPDTQTTEYVINKNSKKIHSPECESAKKTLDKNKETVNWTEEDYLKALEEGYSPCSICKAGR